MSPEPDPEKILEYRKDGNIVFATEEARNKIKNKANRRVSIYILEGKDSLSEIPLPLIDNYIYKQNINKYKGEIFFLEKTEHCQLENILSE